MKKLIVLCDGTWCGSETNTKTNVFLLAEMMGINMSLYNPARAEPIPYHDAGRGMDTCYFPGAGLGGTFLEYIFNGATAYDIDQDCIKVYKYIAEHYTPQHEIWMFGLSRGAYTVRSVAGMINNCGILKRTDGNGVPLLPDVLDRLYQQIYRIYRSRDPADHPESERIRAFKEKASYNVPTPVKFMGLFDTVGSLGIPYLNPGIGPAFEEFHDNKISCAIEKVYHALSIHDRLWCFAPCRALPAKQRVGPQFEIYERWFPGCHYDLGRQRFRFLRNGENLLERVLGKILAPLSKVIEPNKVFSDLVLKWMLEKIWQNDSQPWVIQNININIQDLRASMMAATPTDTGSGDIYDNALAFGPAGRIWEVLTRIFSPLFPGFNMVISELTQTTDRIIPDSDAVLTLYYNQSPELGNRRIADIGKIDSISPTEPSRYPSRTYQDFRTVLTLLDRNVSAASSPS
ncbi:hypothetical protein EC973_003167 [Apophysomyces ossiformis]|uniref:T6SS Phospholipase effector Tle1-like catalytic domain-containing protein n=1 Tax=Apophysomyces ossiformis TaxID=679940 RepID=A0A8H7BLN9_9FUNG|nr:hypothetical protein EC973_003167 [Apophysomyces ossiformis]